MNTQQGQHYLQNQNKMKIYNYLLFRIYRYNFDYCKQNEKEALISTLILSSFALCSIFFILFTYIDFYYFDFTSKISPNKITMFIYILLIAFINYWFFIKNRKFLNYNFNSDKKGGYVIIGFIVFLALSFVFIANKNRDKIFKEREKVRIESKQ